MTGKAQSAPVRRAAAAPARSTAVPQIVRSVIGMDGAKLPTTLREGLGDAVGLDLSGIPPRSRAAPSTIAADDHPDERLADRLARPGHRALSASPGTIHPLDRIRVHTGPLAALAARALRAEAFAVDAHLVFGAGAWRPETADGRALIAHELVHAMRPGSAGTVWRKALPDGTSDADKTTTTDLATIQGQANEPEEEPKAPQATVAAAPSAPAPAAAAPAGAPAGKAPVATPAPGVMAPQMEAAGPKDIPALGIGDLVLIDEELAEHERWGAAAATVGEAGSTERAGFIAEEAGGGAGKGAVEGLKGGIKSTAEMKLAEKVVEKAAIATAVRLGAKAGAFKAVPGVGAVIGGAIAAYDLASRDWDKTGDAIAGFGKGADIYDQLANTIESISTVLEVATQVANIIAGILGIIVVVSWIAAVASAGALGPLATLLSTIAIKIGLVSMVIDAINSIVLKELITTFRALHAFASDADPRDVVAQGEAIEQAAGGATGFVSGFAAGAGLDKGIHMAGEKRPPKLPEHETPPAKGGDGPHVKAEPSPETAQGAGAPEKAPLPEKPAAPPAEAPAAAAPDSKKNAPPDVAPLPPESHTVKAEPPAPPPATEPTAKPAHEAAPPPATAPETHGSEPPVAQAGPATEAAAQPAAPVPEPQIAAAKPAAPPAAQAPEAGVPPKAHSAESPQAGATPEQLTLPGVDVSAPASPPASAAASRTQTDLRPLTPILELQGFHGNEPVPQGLAPGALGTYAVGVAQPHPFALQSQPPGAPGATRRGGRLPKGGRQAAGVYGEHLTPAATIHEVLPGHELHGPQGQRRGGRDTKEALTMSTPEAVKTFKDRADNRLLAEVQRRKAAGENVAPVEVTVRGVMNYQEAVRQSGANVPGYQVSKGFLGEMDQFHDPRFGYQEHRPGSQTAGSSPLAGVSEAELNAHIDRLFDPHIADAPKLPGKAVPAGSQLELPFPEAAGRSGPASEGTPPKAPGGSVSEAESTPPLTASPPPPAPESVSSAPASQGVVEPAAAEGAPLSAPDAAQPPAAAPESTAPTQLPDESPPIPESPRKRVAAPEAEVPAQSDESPPVPESQRKRVATPEADALTPESQRLRVEDLEREAAIRQQGEEEPEAAAQPRRMFLPGLAQTFRPPPGGGANDPSGTLATGGGAPGAAPPGSPKVPTLRSNAPIIERVNPPYQPPPATPQQIVSLRNQVIDTLAARAQQEQYAALMAQQEKHHQENQKPLTDMQKKTGEAISATEAHKAAIARRDEASQRKEEQEKKASEKLDNYDTRAAELKALKYPLLGVQKFTGLASALPDDPDGLRKFKNGLLKMSRDSGNFIAKLDEVDKTIADQKAAGEARKAGVKGDRDTLKQTDDKAASSKDTLSDTKDKTTEIDDTNTERLDQAKSEKTGAVQAAGALDAQAKQKTKQADSLAAAMQFWAQQHRQTRIQAIEQTRKQLEAQRWRVTEAVE